LKNLAWLSSKIAAIADHRFGPHKSSLPFHRLDKKVPFLAAMWVSDKDRSALESSCETAGRAMQAQWRL